MLLSAPGSQVDLKSLFDAQLEGTGEEVPQINFIIDFIDWILRQDFLCLQQPEPVVGGPLSTYPPAVENHGIKGQSVYTALFHHIDMKAFICKVCRHVEENLEDAVIHQRIAHFHHYPYQCLPVHTSWYVPFFPPMGQNQECNFDSAGNDSQVKRGWWNTSTIMDTK